ncbi:aspartyl protease family protein 2-like, partial [Phalaenopsis equestris]|uniref:aspartyl protease family protein 2-like n=1 Tax=Phalaenopsis equestris TaxID=78828 RepID=UPI0009E4682C
ASPAPAGGRRRSKRVFNADLSRSFRPVSCSSDLCRTQLPFSLTNCSTPASPCAYDYQYVEGSSAQGIFASESATVDLLNRRRVKLKGLVLGCTSVAVGSSFVSSDGVLALGYGPNTFVSRATAKFGNLFSYCLVDHLSPPNATGHLTFGQTADLLPHSSSSSSARLLLDPKLQPFYYISVAGISVAGELLPIPATVWNESAGGGAILDSGTTLTVLAEPAYKIVVSAISSRLVEVPRVQVDPFEYCYNWTTEAAAAVPEFTVHFTGAGYLSPPEKSYLIDVSEGVKCIGFSSAPWPAASTIGNILQQEHVWEFDLKNQRLRFQRSNCTKGSVYR